MRPLLRLSFIFALIALIAMLMRLPHLRDDAAFTVDFVRHWIAIVSKP